MAKNIFNKIKNYSPLNLFSFTVSLLIIGTLVNAIAVHEDFYFVALKNETSKNILGTLISTAGAFLGFFVIYMTISFENFKKNYGQYALELFRNNKFIWSVGYLFLLIIISGLLGFLFADTLSYVSTFLFNITCFYFFIAVCLLFPFGNTIIIESSSKDFLKQIVNELTENDFVYKEPENIQVKPVYRILNSDDKNKVTIINEILSHNINHDNTKNGIQIIVNIFNKIEQIVKDKNVNAERKRQTIFTFLDILKNSFDLFHSKKNFVGILTILASLNSCSKIIAEEKYDRRYIERIFETIEHITNSLLQIEEEELIIESLWVYYHMSKDQLTLNMPNENETWMEDEYLGAIPLTNKTAEENDRKFETIDESIAFKFNRLIERSFLCKNSYIVEECVRMLGIFTEIIVFNDNMGELQKERMGASLAYGSCESIKRFITLNYQSKMGYLNLFMGTSTILDALKENSRFSTSIFETFINLSEFLLEKGLVNKFENQEISGLCRLIVGYSGQITAAGGYVGQILKLQEKLKISLEEKIALNDSKSNIRNLKELVQEINKDIKSYLNLMSTKRIVNDSLKETISRFIYEQ